MAIASASGGTKTTGDADPLELFFSRSDFRHNLSKKWGVPKIGDFEGSGAEFEDSGGLGV